MELVPPTLLPKGHVMSHKTAAKWQTCTDQNKDKLESQLRQDISNEHPLYGCDCQAISFVPNKNQVLYKISGAVFDYVVVYLNSKDNGNGEFPDVDFYISYEEWIERHKST
jgi:hypothetical protein